MRAAIPQGTLVFTDQAIVHLLTYYAEDNQLPPAMPHKRGFSENLVGGQWRLAIRDYQYDSRGEYEAALEAFRRQYGFHPKSGSGFWMEAGRQSQASRTMGGRFRERYGCFRRAISFPKVSRSGR
jgi:hypothetical protein